MLQHICFQGYQRYYHCDSKSQGCQTYQLTIHHWEHQQKNYTPVHIKVIEFAPWSGPAWREVMAAHRLFYLLPVILWISGYMFFSLWLTGFLEQRPSPSLKECSACKRHNCESHWQQFWTTLVNYSKGQLQPSALDWVHSRFVKINR